MWLSADEALRRLNVKPQTLYANVSRGRIKAKTDPADPRRSLYSGEDVERLARRSAGRPSAETVAAEAIRWGDPVLPSALSTVIGGRLYYRGRDVAVLAETQRLEQIAALLWQVPGPVELRGRETGGLGLDAAFLLLAERAPRGVPSYGRSPASLRGDAASVLSDVANAICGAGDVPAHERLAARWGRPDSADPLRRALVLLADHELNASTFATRVTVSTGASFAAGALAGLAALSGPLHGSASVAAQSLARRAAEIGPDAALREWLGEARGLPAFGHVLYPDGDVRATALLGAFEVPALFRDLASRAEALLGERPNVDFALAALASAYNLPEIAPIEIFALARSVGWLAHMLEQAETGSLIRPRARYIGLRPPVT